MNMECLLAINTILYTSNLAHGPSLSLVLQLSRKMTKIKEKAIAKGKWPGRAADKSIAKEEEEEEYNEYLSEVSIA